MIKKIFIIFGAILLFLLVGLSIYIFTSAPQLPPEADEIISQVLNSELPEVIKGETGYAESGGVKIWYESIKPDDSAKAVVLLIMGIANDALAWPDYFIQPLVDSGFQVVRYDHRGTGMSDWIDNWHRANPYTLDDMARDGIAIMDAIGAQKIHIIGVSLGGMIAQHIAIYNPERVSTLTSIMSSGYIEDPELPGISIDVIRKLLVTNVKYGLFKSERNTIKLHIACRLLLMGDSIYSLDIQHIAEHVLYNLRTRKGYNPRVSPQHIAATSASGSRYEKLPEINLPTLIIHGKSDPLIPFVHGEKLASLIPDADTLWIEGMGHDIPQIYVDTILLKIISDFHSPGLQ